MFLQLKSVTGFWASGQPFIRTDNSSISGDVRTEELYLQSLFIVQLDQLAMLSCFLLYGILLISAF